jgi:dihydroflavonol-4-reductase
MQVKNDDAKPQTVLVTGGSGYVGSWAVVELLQRGYRVRTTVRTLMRETDLRSMIAGQVDAGERLSVFAANLLGDEGWEQALEGSDYVLHVASPMPIGEYRGQDVIRPAREGVRRVLQAALNAGVKRVVLTSSTAAAMLKQGNRIKVDETIWTDLPAKKIYDYPRAKTLAEQDAWEIVSKSGGRIELSSILPSSIQGPVLGSDYSASVDIVGLMLRGKMPAVPRIGFGIVDVRDLVDLHIRAMTLPIAAGERFIAAGEFLWFSDIARLLRENLGEKAAKVPTRTLPDWLVRTGSLFNAELAQLAPSLGVLAETNTAKADRMLGWRSRSAKDAILDTANSLIAKGLV